MPRPKASRAPTWLPPWEKKTYRYCTCPLKIFEIKNLRITILLSNRFILVSRSIRKLDKYFIMTDCQQHVWHFHRFSFFIPTNFKIEQKISELLVSSFRMPIHKVLQLWANNSVSYLTGKTFILIVNCESCFVFIVNGTSLRHKNTRMFQSSSVFYFPISTNPVF